MILIRVNCQSDVYNTTITYNMKLKSCIILFLMSLTLFSITSCRNEDLPEGKLFIIGGGKRPPSLMKTLVDQAELQKNDYLVILPFASSEPKLTAESVKIEFMALTNNPVAILYQPEEDTFTPSIIDSIRNARLIFICGGDQQKFMEVIEGSDIAKAIQLAYNNGAIISGTSAGAAVMSKKMLTGKEFKHPEYTGNFTTIEADNIELIEGLGLMQNCIIDQHFIKRMRMNRLISVAIENAYTQCIGIDESTAILVYKGNARVYGLSQVVVLINNSKHIIERDGLLEAKNLSMKVLLPGSSFLIK